MIQVVPIYYLIFGLLTLIGGSVAYQTTKALFTLIGGIVCGLALLAAGIVMSTGHTNIGLIIGILFTVALAGRFIPKVLLNRAPIHLVFMAALSALGVILTLIAFAKK